MFFDNDHKIYIYFQSSLKKLREQKEFFENEAIEHSESSQHEIECLKNQIKTLELDQFKYSHEINDLKRQISVKNMDFHLLKVQISEKIRNITESKKINIEEQHNRVRSEDSDSITNESRWRLCELSICKGKSSTRKRPDGTPYKSHKYEIYCPLKKTENLDSSKQTGDWEDAPDVEKHLDELKDWINKFETPVDWQTEKKRTEYEEIIENLKAKLKNAGANYQTVIYFLFEFI